MNIDLKIETYFIHPCNNNRKQLNKQDNPMNFIRRMLITKANTTKLGRWQLHYDPKVVNSKVDQANEDHCGCCHEPAQPQAVKKEKMLHQKQKWQEKQRRHCTQKQLQKYSESEEYYVPYVM